MKASFLILFTLFFISSGKGQQAQSPKEFNEIRIISVIDSTQKLSKNFVQVFTKSIYKNVKAGLYSDSIVLVINEIMYKEKMVGQLIEGEIGATFSFYKIKNQKNRYLTAATSKRIYKRSLGGNFQKNEDKLVMDCVVQNLSFLENWIKINRKYHPAFIEICRIEIMPAYAQNDEDTVYYGTKEITWEDFRAQPTEVSRFEAAIFPNIAFLLDVTIDNQVLIAKFTPKVYMIRGMSWTRRNSLSEYALKHERLHFDIAMVVMKEYIKKVQEINETEPDMLISRIQFEYLEAYGAMNRLQEAYDSDTNHSLNVSQQRLWEEKIKEMLKTD